MSLGESTYIKLFQFINYELIYINQIFIIQLLYYLKGDFTNCFSYSFSAKDQIDKQ